VIYAAESGKAENLPLSPCGRPQKEQKDLAKAEPSKSN
jgi:hypothetical protein